MTDTSKRKTARAGKRTSLADDLLDHSFDGIAVADKKGMIKYVNPAMAKLLGYSKGECPSIHAMARLLFPDRRNRTSVLKDWAEDIRSADTPERVYLLTRHDGAQRYCRFRMATMASGDIVINGQDITEFCSAQQALQESEKQFRTLAERSPNMIFINQGGRIVYANARCEEVMGYTRKELCSETFDFLSLIAPEYHARTKRNFKKHAKRAEVPPYEYAVVTKSGRRIDAWIATRLIPYGGGSAILGIVADISSLKRTQSKLARSQKELRRQKKELEEKNTAMRHMLDQVEKQRSEMTGRIRRNIEDLLMPALLRLKKQAAPIDARDLDIVLRHVDQLTSRFGIELSKASTTLSPRELEICDLV